MTIRVTERNNRATNGSGDDRGRIRVVLGEHSLLIREGVQQIAASTTDLDFLGSADDVDSLRTMINELEPNVVVTEVGLQPNHAEEGLALAKELRLARPEIGVVVLTDHLSPAGTASLFEGGSSRRACVLKSQLAERDQLIDVIRQVQTGGTHLDVKLLDAFVGNRPDETASVTRPLTTREQEVLALLAAGHSNSKIAEQLFVTTRGVERHVNSIFKKLRLEDSEAQNRRVMAALWFRDHVSSDGSAATEIPAGDKGKLLTPKIVRRAETRAYRAPA